MNNKHMNKIRLFFALAFISFASACEGPEAVKPVYLEVNANNISGKWELVEWSGVTMTDGTYVFIDIVRNDRTYTIYQNVDSFQNVPHVVTGSYYLEIDPEIGAVIRGNYDHDSGDWAHRYIITDLTADQMTWTAKDNLDYVQKFKRVESIPVAE